MHELELTRQIGEYKDKTRGLIVASDLERPQPGEYTPGHLVDLLWTQAPMAVVLNNFASSCHLTAAELRKNIGHPSLVSALETKTDFFKLLPQTVRHLAKDRIVTYKDFLGRFSTGLTALMLKGTVFISKEDIFDWEWSCDCGYPSLPKIFNFSVLERGSPLALRKLLWEITPNQVDFGIMSVIDRYREEGNLLGELILTRMGYKALEAAVGGREANPLVSPGARTILDLFSKGGNQLEASRNKPYRRAGWDVLERLSETLEAGTEQDLKVFEKFKEFSEAGIYSLATFKLFLEDHPHLADREELTRIVVKNLLASSPEFHGQLKTRSGGLLSDFEAKALSLGLHNFLREILANPISDKIPPDCEHTEKIMAGMQEEVLGLAQKFKNGEIEKMFLSQPRKYLIGALIERAVKHGITLRLGTIIASLLYVLDDEELVKMTKQVSEDRRLPQNDEIKKSCQIISQVITDPQKAANAVNDLVINR